MDKILQEDFWFISPQTKGALTSPLSPKRPKTEYTMTTFQELLTRQKSTESPSSLSMWQKIAGLVCTAEIGDTKEETSHQQQDTEFIVTPVTKLPSSHADNAHMGSSKCCFITAERHFLLLLKNEQPQVTERVKLSSYPRDAGEALAEPHTSKDTDTSSHPDCEELGESLVIKPPVVCNLPASNSEDGRQVEVFSHTSSDEEVKCQSDCTHDDVLHDASFCSTFSQSVVAEERNQKMNDNGFTENILFSKGTKKGKSLTYSSYYAAVKSPSGGLTEYVKNEVKILELQICEKEKFAACDGETKGQINEKCLSKNSILASSECAKVSIVSHNMVLVSSIPNENVSPEAFVFCAAKREHAAGKMIAKAQSETADHTTESPMPARSSQEPAEGDNDVGPLSVIDPAILSETDRGAEEKCCNSVSAAGAELAPSVKVYEMEMAPPLCSDIKPSNDVSTPDQTWHSNQHCRTHTWIDEKEDLGHAEPKACPITTNETQKIVGSCLWKSSPSSSPKLPSPESGRQASHESVGQELREHNQPDFFPVRLDHLTTQGVKYLEIKIAKKDRATEITKKEEIHIEGEGESDEHRKSESSVDLQEKFVQLNEEQKEPTTETTTRDCINGPAVGEISNYGNKLTHTEEELADDLESMSDHLYRAVIPIKEGTTEEKNEETGLHGNSDILVMSENGLQQHGLQQLSPQKEDMTEASPDDSIIEWTEGKMSQSSCKLSQSNRYSDYQHKAETLMVGNKNDFLSYTFTTASNAVLPAPQESIPSQKNYNSSALKCCDRFSPLPSAVTFCDSTLGGFDTFERIQLSLDDGYDNDTGLSNSPVLASLPGLLKTPQQQLQYSTPESQSNKEEEIPADVEEEVEHFEDDTENMANGFLSSDYSCNELLSTLSEADVTPLARPEQKPNSESAWNPSERVQDHFNPQSVPSSESRSPGSGVSDSPGFEMKKRFGMVLKELNLYFDISSRDCVSSSRTLSPEHHSEVAEAIMEDASGCKQQLRGPNLQHHRDTSSDEEHRKLDMCGGDPLVSCTSGTGEGKQEVALGSQLCLEPSINTSEQHREPQETEQKRKMWSPSFSGQPFLEQLSLRPPQQARRLEPLKTCTRPIRLGLSKRAKTKHLHCSHPYK